MAVLNPDPWTKKLQQKWNKTFSLVNYIFIGWKTPGDCFCFQSIHNFHLHKVTDIWWKKKIANLSHKYRKSPFPFLVSLQNILFKIKNKIKPKFFTHISIDKIMNDQQRLVDPRFFKRGRWGLGRDPGTMHVS